MNTWRHTSIPSYFLMAWCAIKSTEVVMPLHSSIMYRVYSSFSAVDSSPCFHTELKYLQILSYKMKYVGLQSSLTCRSNDIGMPKFSVYNTSYNSCTFCITIMRRISFWKLTFLVDHYLWLWEQKFLENILLLLSWRIRRSGLFPFVINSKFVNLTDSWKVSLDGWSAVSQCRYLQRTAQTQKKRTHLCLEWDSNPCALC
jgi:hypothetical protein